jgi:hypothetical protein
MPGIVQPARKGCGGTLTSAKQHCRRALFCGLLLRSPHRAGAAPRTARELGTVRPSQAPLRGRVPQKLWSLKPAVSTTSVSWSPGTSQSEGTGRSTTGQTGLPPESRLPGRHRGDPQPRQNCGFMFRKDQRAAGAVDIHRCDPISPAPIGCAATPLGTCQLAALGAVLRPLGGNARGANPDYAQPARFEEIPAKRRPVISRATKKRRLPET